MFVVCGPKYNITFASAASISPLDADRLTTRALYISDHVLSFFLSFFLSDSLRNEQIGTEHEVWLRWPTTAGCVSRSRSTS